MQLREYQLRFTTPAFLGDAEQNGRWRTPPFKALLRQWWRVAYAAEKNFDVGEMRRAEALLFGHAWLENDSAAARKSLVRLRLDRWDEGKLISWDGLEQGRVRHPDVAQTNFQVGPHAYLGFGPLDGRGGTKLARRNAATKPNAAIQAGETAMLSLAMPDGEAPRIERALWLMDRYGSVGGRSRNGWGSFSLACPSQKDLSVPLRDWIRCLALDWPHAVGQDARPLIWQTQACDNWKAVMKRLAEIKIGLRTQFRFTTGKNAPHPEDRHWLSYPVTNHSVQAWGNNARLPNTLRFKVRPTAEGQLIGVIFHVPHKPPAKFHPNTDTLTGVWRRVHAYLDDQLTRIPE